MPLIKQSAFISQSPITANIGGAFTNFPPTTAIVPAYNIQEDGVIIANGKGKWVASFDFWGVNSSGATTFSLPDVEGSYGAFLSAVPSTITSLDAPILVYVGGSILSSSPSTLASLATISLPKLYYVGSSIFSNYTFSALTSLDVSSLAYCGSSITLVANSLTSISFPSIRYIGSLFTLTSTSCTSINLSSLVFAGGGITITAASCTTLTLPTLGVLKVHAGNFTATTCAFNQTTVDNILAALAYLDGTNGTNLFGTGRTVSITGTSSAPSNAGSTTTAGSNFVGSTTTCTVNMTAHGYATDDVLRISGITTLTNANKYARITVVNANQFTYSITSQTATGAGTATIVKANASAKALVTRFVTLTTN